MLMRMLFGATVSYRLDLCYGRFGYNYRRNIRGKGSNFKDIVGNIFCIRAFEAFRTSGHIYHFYLLVGRQLIVKIRQFIDTSRQIINRRTDYMPQTNWYVTETCTVGHN